VARPAAPVAAFILEAGLPGEVLHAEVEAMAQAARRAGVAVVGGDTKVVEHGLADGMYITTCGIGRPDPRLHLSARDVHPGDRVLLSGPIGDHGITILLARGDLDLEADLRSDTRPVTPLIGALAEAAAPGVRWMRDPTRGGVASALNELARETDRGIVLFEDGIPIRDEVRGACEILGLDPFHIANEGQVLVVVAPEFAEQALQAMRAVPGSERAALIGEIRPQPQGTVGRLFDAVAALLGFTREITFEGQAAVWLEQLARRSASVSAFPFPVGDAEMDFRPLLDAVIAARLADREPAEVARAFHAAVAGGLWRAACACCDAHGVDTVVLSGGVFQNALLLALLKDAMPERRRRPALCINQRVPANDGGISLGQAAVAACRAMSTSMPCS
jgi:hydrogenase expression/formation protein HypE